MPTHSSNPYSPCGLMLLGRDPEFDTYHWEGPFPGTVWETTPGRLFGLLKAYGDDGGQPVKSWDSLGGQELTHYLINSNTEKFLLEEGDTEWAVVVAKRDGRVIRWVRKDALFTAKPNPIGTLETLSNKTSPCAIVSALLRGA